MPKVVVASEFESGWSRSIGIRPDSRTCVAVRPHARHTMVPIEKKRDVAFHAVVRPRHPRGREWADVSVSREESDHDDLVVDQIAAAAAQPPRMPAGRRVREIIHFRPAILRVGRLISRSHRGRHQRNAHQNNPFSIDIADGCQEGTPFGSARLGQDSGVLETALSGVVRRRRQNPLDAVSLSFTPDNLRRPIALPRIRQPVSVRI